MSKQGWLRAFALMGTLASCGDDESTTSATDATTDGPSTQQDARQPDSSTGGDAQVKREAGTSPEAGAGDSSTAGDGSMATDGGTCEPKAPVAPGEQSCSAEDVTCFFEADTEQERQKCAEQSDTGASCLGCVLLGGAACAYENGCVAVWNDLYCCHQRECGNEPFELCAACSVQAAARQACETGVGIACLSAGTSCFPPI